MKLPPALTPEEDETMAIRISTEGRTCGLVYGRDDHKRTCGLPASVAFRLRNGDVAFCANHERLAAITVEHMEAEEGKT